MQNPKNTLPLFQLYKLHLIQFNFFLLILSSCHLGFLYFSLSQTMKDSSQNIQTFSTTGNAFHRKREASREISNWPSSSSFKGVTPQEVNNKFETFSDKVSDLGQSQISVTKSEGQLVQYFLKSISSMMKQSEENQKIFLNQIREIKQHQASKADYPEARFEFQTAMNDMRDSMEKLTSTIFQLSREKQRSDQPFHSSISKEDMPEQRFRLIDFKIPQLKSYPLENQNCSENNQIDQIQLERRYKIDEWFGQVIPKILSSGFHAFENEKMDENQVKVYCSELIILAYVKLIKKNQLKENELKYINEDCLKRILEYNFDKYPQTLETEKNKELNDIIVQKDDIEDPFNDLVGKSKIQFKLKSDGQDYNQEIMRFINFLIKLMRDRRVYDKNCQEKEEEDQDIKSSQHIFGALRRSSLEKITSIESQNDKENDNPTLTKKFEEDMRNLMEMLQTESIVEEMNSYNFKEKENDQEKNEKLFETYMYDSIFDIREKKISVHEEKLRKFKGRQESIIEIEAEDRLKDQMKKYQQEVKSYTTFVIGPKISPNTPLFTETEIDNGDLYFNNSTIFRVVVKWVEEIEKYFDEKTILMREYPYRMRIGEGFLEREQFERLSSYLQYFKKAKGGPVEFLKKINQNNYLHQRQFASQSIPAELKKFTEEEAAVGLYSSLIEINSETYLIQYLNCLIHTILKATQMFHFSILYGDKEASEQNFKALQQRYISDFFSLDFYNKVQRANKMTPSLISFKLGDLLRCKLASKKKEIKAVYKELVRLSKLQSNLLKIVRVKNRLETGNRDILINLMYRKTLLIEIQLGVKETKSQFINFSNKFSHYIYELKRPIFGPITEACSIWKNRDPRSKHYLEFFHNSPEKPHFKQCLHPITSKKSNGLPFTCHLCSNFYPNTLYRSYFCSECGGIVCYHCQFEAITKEENKNEGCKKVWLYCSEQIQKQKSMKRAFEMMPQFCVLDNIKSSKKNEKEVLKMVFEGKLYYFQKVGRQSVKLIIKIGKKKELNKFLRDNILFINQDSFKSDEGVANFIQEKYLLYEILNQMSEKEKESITILGRKITDKTIKDFSQSKKTFKDVKKMNLSENEIENISTIELLKAENLSTLILRKNNFKEIETNGNFIKLRELDLSENQHLEKIKINLTSMKIFKNLHLFECTQLKELSIKNWERLKKIPQSFMTLKNLKTLTLQQCNNLIGLPSNFGAMESLETMKLLSLRKFQELPESLGNIQALKKISIIKCERLEELIDGLGLLTNLEEIDLSSCTSIVTLPESLSCNNHLKTLNLSNCFNLSGLPAEIGNLKQLRMIDLRNCRNLEKLPESLGSLEKMSELHLQGCEKLLELPLSFGKLNNLQEVDLKNCKKLERIPETFSDLIKLKIVNLHKCQSLSALPHRIGSLHNLQSLDLSYCLKLQKLPESIKNLTSLKTLNCQSCATLATLPQGIGNLVCLQRMDLSSCINLRFLPKSFQKLNSLQFLKLEMCENLSQLPKNMENLKCLESIDLSSCSRLERLPQSLTMLRSLKMIDLKSCTSLKELPENFSKLSNLEEVDLRNCVCIEKLPRSFGSLKKLKKIQLFKCEGLREIPSDFGDLDSLEFVDLSSFQSLEQLPESFGNLHSLKVLNLEFFSKLQFLPTSFGNLRSLIEIDLSYCTKIKDLPESFHNLLKVKTIKLHKCESLTTLPSKIGNLSSLEEIDLSYCMDLTALPESFTLLKSLRVLNLFNCQNLQLLPEGFSNLSSLKQLDIRNCHNLDKIPEALANLKNLTKIQVNKGENFMWKVPHFKCFV